MKNRILAIAGLTLLAAASAFAQHSQIIRVNVPFAFQANGHPMPAGRYAIREQSAGVLRLDGPGNAGITLMAHAEVARKAYARGTAIFYQVDGRYFLKGVWQAGEQEGMQLYPTRAERRMLDSMKQSSSPVTVAVNSEPALQQ